MPEYNDRDLQFLGKLKAEWYDFNKSIWLLNEAKKRQATTDTTIVDQKIKPPLAPERQALIDQVKPLSDKAITKSIWGYVKWVWGEIAEWLRGIWSDVYRQTHPTEAVEMWVKPEWVLGKMWEQISENIEWYKASAEGLKKWEQDKYDTFMQMLMESWDVALTPLREVFGSALDVVTPETTEEQLKWIVQGVMSTEWWQKVMEWLQKVSEEYEKTKVTDPWQARNLRASAKWAEFFLDLAWVQLTKKAIKKSVKEWLKQPLKQAPKEIPSLWQLVKRDIAWIKGIPKAVWKTVSEVTTKLQPTKEQILTKLRWVKGITTKVWKGVEEWTEKVAWKILWSKSWKKELFQAASPSYQTLWKDKNIVNIWKNIEKADKTVLKYWYKPVDTESRALAYKDSMKKVWKQVDEARGWTPAKVNAKTFADDIEKFIETKKISWQINPEHLTDIKALQKQAAYFKKLWEIDVPTLWQIRADLNAMTSFKSQNPFWDVYNTGLKDIWKIIRNTENNLIESYKWTKFWKLMQEYRALAETYPDIIKANIKNMRAKWASLEESFSRITWIWDILKGTLDVVTKWQQGIWEVAKWLWKVSLWKVYWKLKDPDFLVKEWYKKLSKSLPSKKIKNVNNINIDTDSAIKYSKKPAKISWQKREIEITKPKIVTPQTKQAGQKLTDKAIIKESKKWLKTPTKKI